MKWMFLSADICSVIFEAYIISVFFGALGRAKKANLWLRLLAYVAFVALIAVIYYFISDTWAKLVSMFVFIVFLSFLYEVDAKSRCVGVIVFFLFINLCELIAGFLLSAIFSMTVDGIRDSLIYYTVGVFASKSLALFCVKVFAHRFRYAEIRISAKQAALFALFPLVTIGVGIVLIGCFGAGTDPVFAVAGAVASLLLAASNVLVFYLFEEYARQNKRRSLLEMDKMQLEMQAQYSAELIEKQQASAREMHDLKNALFAIRQLISADDEQAAARVDGICRTVNGMQSIVYTGDAGVDALINAKTASFAEKGIDFDCTCYIAGFDGIDLIDLCVLTGNLLDNAFEACMKLETGRRIKLAFTQSGNLICINISNPFDGALPEDGQTSKQDKMSHGFGLRRVKSLAEKYGGAVEISTDDNVFSVSVALLCDGAKVG